MKYIIVDKVCGGIAFFSDHLINGDDIVSPVGMTLVDGSVPEAGTPIRCGACGRGADRHMTDFIIVEEPVEEYFCPDDNSPLNFIFNSRLDGENEYIGLCPQCKKAWREPSLGWQITKS